MNERYGELLQVKELKTKSTEKILQSLCHFIGRLGLEIGEAQKTSWVVCIDYLKQTFAVTTAYDDVYVLFEYCIYLTSYRRPDVILLFDDSVLVLEFKRKNVVLETDKAQLRGYLKELRHYHQVSHEQNLCIQGALVVTESVNEKVTQTAGISIVEGNQLNCFLSGLKLTNPMKEEEVQSWIYSPYLPLLNILRATRDIFVNHKIPQIKNIEQKHIQEIQDYILREIQADDNKKKIFFLGGVPGAGKTLVLLNLLYELNKDSGESNFIQSLFTSGNDPLISVLTYILSKEATKLEGEAFIKKISAIKANYNKKSNSVSQNTPSYPTILFDESQRSWDLAQMQKYQYQISEPELLLKLQNKAYADHKSANLVCSYGEGQSIYLGEEGGFEVWSEVLKQPEYHDWHVYCPESFGSYFQDRPNTHIVKELFMQKSIRGNFVDLDPFINGVLNGDLEFAKAAVLEVVSQGFDLKLSRNFGAIQSYLSEYSNQCRDKFYGLVCSSYASENTLKRTIPYFKKVLSQRENGRLGNWYVQDSSQLNEAVSEFGCQGLELNIPIVVLGRDYVMKDGRWQISESVLKEADSGTYKYRKIKEFKDKDTIFDNIYRVLLSRGRKGLILFIPPQCSDLDETYQFFKELDIEELN